VFRLALPDKGHDGYGAVLSIFFVYVRYGLGLGLAGVVGFDSCPAHSTFGRCAPPRILVCGGLAMWIDKDVCIACEGSVSRTVPRAPSQSARTALVKSTLICCVECGVCAQAGVCDSGAIQIDELEWPRLIRRTYTMSCMNIRELHDRPGHRGNEDPTKSPGISGAVSRHRVEIGRPDVGTTFHDVDKITRAMAALGASFPPGSPTTKLMTDPATGTIRPTCSMSA